MTTDITCEGVHSDQDAEELRGAMVDEVIVREWLGLGPPREVEAALRTVPRHLFAPGVALEKAYADAAIVTKRNEGGGSLSSVSAPWLHIDCGRLWSRYAGCWLTPTGTAPAIRSGWTS